MDNDTVLLPMIFQHVRELAEGHTAPTEKQRYKILTPFPPAFNDFPDFQPEQLEFGDPQTDADAAASDTNQAFQFFRNTDYLYYNYSYGIKQEEPTLSKVCREFYDNAIFVDPDETNFIASFAEKKDAFLRKYERFTTGDLGQNRFVDTSYSPLRWDSNKVSLTPDAIKRIKEKTIAVYANPQLSNDYINSLIAQVYGSSYNSIEYEFGFFDVVREWIDPALFESPKWKFKEADKVLYGDHDQSFESGDTSLCYAQRFYIVRNYSGTSDAGIAGQPAGATIVNTPAPQPAPQRMAQPMAHASGFGPFSVGVRDHRTISPAPIIRDHRRTVVRNELLNRRVMGNAPGPRNFRSAAVTPAGGPPGFVWVAATAGVSGHWERVRASQPAVPTPPTVPAAPPPPCRVAAILCRVLPRKPVATT
jgi:hypothetical protein